MAVAGPTDSNVGQPFWTIMDVRDGVNTGTYYANRISDGSWHIPIFFSKKHADMMLNSIKKYSHNWTVVGLEQHNLRSFILTLNGFSWQTMLYWHAPGAIKEAQDSLIRIPVNTKDLEKEYYLGEVPYIKPLSEY
ncbi:hypothetical protein D0S45_19450 [Marinifilum sp. JC120]|nr:hypothetical protein D0S45_19450 [Marinifilum sp. JC120]